jgi:hypothetical protein
MEDDFYDTVSNHSVPITTSWVGSTWKTASSPNVILALVLGPFIIAAVTRYLSSRPSLQVGDEKSAWKVPYWIPFVGHGFSLYVTRNENEGKPLINESSLWDPAKMLREAK